MASTFMVQLPGTLSASAIATVAVAGIYLLLRKRASASRARVLVATSFCLLALMCGFGLLSRHSARSINLGTGVRYTSPAARVTPTGRLLSVSLRPMDAPRAVYGHSIVKGGIHSLAELLNVIATDPLAAQHYKGFDISRARFIRLDHNIMAYVSYRVDGKGIYWTSKPELIMAGEEVITDGTNFIRVRCGNMISYAPQSPAETDSPTDTNTIVETFTPFSDPPLGIDAGIPPSGTPSAGIPPAGTPPPGCCSSIGGITPPPIFTLPPSPNTPGNPGTPPNTVSVDEFSPHGMFYTLLSALVGLFLIRKLFP
ncbi:MAG: hypothetical protein WA871_03875 [Candidatus Acidiferrales bacterium]